MRKIITVAIITMFLAGYGVAVNLIDKVHPIQVADIRFSNGSEAHDMPVATTKEQQAQGLKGEQDVSRGMLFLWEREQELYFWMQDTPQPLSIAFFDREHRITAIADMQPFSEDKHFSPGPALGAIELPQGAFEALGVQEGMTLTISPSRAPEPKTERPRGAMHLGAFHSPQVRQHLCERSPNG